MSRYERAADRFFAAWNASDEDIRAKAVAAAWTEDAVYLDPKIDTSGHDQLAAAIGGVLAQLPGYEFRRVGAVDGHHDVARFSWELVSLADGSAPAAGTDVITLGDDDRITRVVGFLDRELAA
ncbi:nuclear transport factor 2 family protein [Nocardia sp. CNY236]|uniref:nuclear transport factor 2 family protein n=1 Tax=Nocardia sp. CNY236 TaxID=1169152 RepID=UPI0003F61BC5|nr:nuclear transport factor 2 family protein [Nocardia sp. CNY236]